MHLKHRLRRAAIVLALPAALAVPRVGFAEQAAVEQIRGGTEAQTRIRAQTKELATQIDAVLAEFDGNGIAGDDVTVLRSIRGVLYGLSDAQMQQVIDLLNKATAAAPSDPAASRRSLTDAVLGQKTITNQLGHLLQEYRRQQAVYELSARLDKLGERQDANLKQSIALAKESSGTPQAGMTTAQKEQLQVQQAEQNQIRDEVRQAMADLAAVATNPDAPHQDRLSTAARHARQQKVDETAAQAAAALQQASIYRAAMAQKQVRDQLRDLSKLVAPPKDKLAQLQDAASAVDKAIADQTDLAADTPASDAKESEQKQADLVDKTDRVKQDVKDVAPAAAQHIADAQERMQQARAELNKKEKRTAANEQKKASDALQQAKTELESQIAQEQKARADQQQQAPQDNLEAAKTLLAKTKELRTKLAALMSEVTGASTGQQRLAAKERQDLLGATARELQAQSVAEAPAATEHFSLAASRMGRAGQTLGDAARADAERNAAAAEQQRQADESLAAAEKLLEQAVKQLEQARQELQQVEKAREQIADLMKEQQDVAQQTADKAQQQPQPQDERQQEQLARQQQQLAQQAQALQQQVPESTAAAKEPLSKAQQEMAQAQQQLQQQQNPQARQDQQQAMDQLAKARQAMDQRTEELRQQLGVQPPPGPSLKEVADRLDKAEKQVEQAKGEPPKQGAPQLENTSRELADLNAEASKDLPPDAEQAVRQAQDALTDAAAQAKADKGKPAKENAEKAQAAIQRAKSAVELAMQMQAMPQTPMAMTPQPPVPGQPQDSQQPKPPTPGMPNPDPKKSDAQASNAGLNGLRGNARTQAKFLGLPERDRQVLLSAGSEKYPEEYGPTIEQYLRNLADEGARK